MVQLIRSNSPFTVIILFIYALVINYQALFNPQLPQVPEGQYLYGVITKFFLIIFFKKAFIFTLFSTLLLALQGVILNVIVNVGRLFPKSSYAVAFTYISLSSIYPDLAYFSQPLLANWLIIILFGLIYKLAQTNKPRQVIYNMAFVVGLAPLLHFPLVVFVLLLFVAIALLRSFIPGEWLVALLGVFTPVYLVSGFLFLFDALYVMPGVIELGVNLPRSLINPVYLIGLLAAVIILFFMGVYKLQGHINKLNVYIRRCWTVTSISFFISMLAAVFTTQSINSAWLVIIPSLSLLTANIYYSEKSKAFSNFAFYFMILLVVFCKITYMPQ